MEFFAEKGHPIMVILSYGTTFKGAYDDVKAVGATLEPILQRHGLYERKVEFEPGKCDIRSGYWMHVDAALGGVYMPFLKMPKRLAWSRMPARISTSRCHMSTLLQ